jgi:hypothetical protein
VSESEGELHFLAIRPDFDDPYTFDNGVLALHVLASTDRGFTIHTFLVEVAELDELEPPSPDLRTICVRGRLLAGESIVCMLRYDDSDLIQMLSIKSERD